MVFNAIKIGVKRQEWDNFLLFASTQRWSDDVVRNRFFYVFSKSKNLSHTNVSIGSVPRLYDFFVILRLFRTFMGFNRALERTTGGAAIEYHCWVAVYIKERLQSAAILYYSRRRIVSVTSRTSGSLILTSLVHLKVIENHCQRTFCMEASQQA